MNILSKFSAGNFNTVEQYSHHTIFAIDNSSDMIPGVEAQSFLLEGGINLSCYLDEKLRFTIHSHCLHIENDWDELFSQSPVVYLEQDGSFTAPAFSSKNYGKTCFTCSEFSPDESEVIFPSEEHILGADGIADDVGIGDGFKGLLPLSCEQEGVDACGNGECRQ